jgi:hypothetical protein
VLDISRKSFDRKPCNKIRSFRPYLSLGISLRAHLERSGRAEEGCSRGEGNHRGGKEKGSRELHGNSRLTSCQGKCYDSIVKEGVADLRILQSCGRHTSGLVLVPAGYYFTTCTCSSYMRALQTGFGTSSHRTGRPVS